MLIIAISFRSSCLSAIRASPIISFSFQYRECQGLPICSLKSCGFDIPRNWSQYCGSPKLATKSAHCPVVHCKIELPGESFSVSERPKVGVGSVEGGSESVGEVSSSVGRMGEVISVRSYSSSASESA